MKIIRDFLKRVMQKHIRFKSIDYVLFAPKVVKEKLKDLWFCTMEFCVSIRRTPGEYFLPAL